MILNSIVHIFWSLWYTSPMLWCLVSFIKFETNACFSMCTFCTWPRLFVECLIFVWEAMEINLKLNLNLKTHITTNKIMVMQALILVDTEEYRNSMTCIGSYCIEPETNAIFWRLYFGLTTGAPYISPATMYSLHTGSSLGKNNLHSWKIWLRWYMCTEYDDWN